jgi:hypothetical protein
MENTEFTTVDCLYSDYRWYRNNYEMLKSEINNLQLVVRDNSEKFRKGTKAKEVLELLFTTLTRMSYAKVEDPQSVSLDKVRKVLDWRISRRDIAP